MSAPVWPDHLVTFSEWQQYPEYERFKVEVAEGVLSVSPRPMVRHQIAVHNIVAALNTQLPPDLVAVAEIDLVVSRAPLTVRVPDVAVIPAVLLDANPAHVEAADVTLVVEVLSEGSVRTDRVMKFAEYAEAGIARYWLVSHTPPELRAFTLDGGSYRPAGEFVGEAVLDVVGEQVVVDVAALSEP